MRVAFYNVTTANRQGGIETAVWELGREVAVLGHDVVILSGRGTENVPARPARLREFPFLRREYLPFCSLRVQKLVERATFFFAALPHLVACRYHLFFIFKPFDFPVALFLKCIRPSTTVVFVSGGFDFFYVDRFLHSFVDRIYAVSRDNAAVLERRYHRPVAVAPNGVDATAFFPSEGARAATRARFGIPGDAPVLVSVGRLIGWKAHELVVRALPALPAFRYLLVGAGEERARLERLSHDLGVENRLVFAGGVAHAEVPLFLNAADVYVQPSRGNEAFGIVLLEAMACGVPVVASDSGGMADIVRDGESGAVFPAGDVFAMCRAIRLVFDRRRQLASRCRPYVLAHFSWKRTASVLLEAAGVN